MIFNIPIVEEFPIRTEDTNVTTNFPRMHK
jgi:hypothetical protein